MLIRERLTQQLKSLRYNGLSSPERRRLNDYLQHVSHTLADVTRTIESRERKTIRAPKIRTLGKNFTEAQPPEDKVTTRKE